MRTIRTKVYKFSELSKEAQSKAIERERQAYNESGEPLIFFKDYCEEQSGNEGFYNCEFQWSLSYSQGDGLSFSGNIDIDTLIKECYPNCKKSVIDVLRQNCTIEIKGNKKRYAFAAKSDVDLWIDIYTPETKNKDNINSIVSDLLCKLEDKYLSLCKELEKGGYSWIESENEESSIIDRIESNEWEFTQDGRMI